MPTYTYLCMKCQKKEDRLGIPVDLRNDQCCKECGTKLLRQLSIPEFHLKGSGWAKDGYATYVGDVDKETARVAKQQMKEAAKERRKAK